jgi:hypothetical protein
MDAGVGIGLLFLDHALIQIYTQEMSIVSSLAERFNKK